MVPVVVAWPWPVVQRFSVLVSPLVLLCCPVAAPLLPVLLVVRPRWPVVPVQLAPLVLPLVQLARLLVPREPLAAQAQQAVELTPPVVVVAQAVLAGAEPVELVLVAVLVLLVVPLTPSAGMLRAGIVPLVDLLVKPWEPKAQTKVLVQLPVLVAPIVLVGRRLLPVPPPVPQATPIALPVLAPRPRGPANPQAQTVELLVPRLLVPLPGPVLQRGHRKRQHLMPVPRTLHPRQRRQRTPQLSR